MSIDKPILSFGNNQHLPITIKDIIYSISSGVSVNSEDIPVVNNIEFGILKTSCVSNGLFIPNKNKKVLPIEYSRVKQPVELGSLIVSRMNTPSLVGEVAYISKSYNNLFLPDRLWNVRTKKSYEPRWLASYLTTPKIKFRLKELATGTSGSMKNISQPSFISIKLFSPKLQEQQKIASFLTSVDSKISQLTEKHRLLKEYKKGVMQQIFSQQLRFKDKDGKAFPEWEYKKGNKLFKAVSNKKHNSDLPILAITQNQGAIPRELINYEVQVTDNSVAGYKVVEKGDFIISLRSFQGGIEFSNYKGICSPAYIILQPNVVIDNVFYQRYLKTHNFIQEMKKRLEGIRDGKILSYKYFSEIELPFPSIKEQQKIAQFLQSIDKKIDVVAQQVEQTKQFKKGLLQQMFV